MKRNTLWMLAAMAGLTGLAAASAQVIDNSETRVQTTLDPGLKRIGTITREKHVRQGRMISADGRLRVRLNQATGVNPKVAPRTAGATNADGRPLLNGPTPKLEPGGAAP